MITDAEIDWVIAMMEDPHAHPFNKAVARKIADKYIEQENLALVPYIVESRKKALTEW